MALVGTRLFGILAPTWYLPAEEIRVDGMVLGFTLGLSLLTAILFGMAPALRASNPDLARSLKQGGRGSRGGSRPLVQNLLVGSQIAITLVLLTGAGLMVNSFVRLVAVDRGFNPEQLLTAQVDVLGGVNERYIRFIRVEGGDSRIAGVTPEVDVFYREVLERLRAVPGVEAAEMASNPLNRRNSPNFTILSGPGEQRRVSYVWASPGFFSVMGIPLLRGRSFTAGDTESSPWVAIINETMARRFFPDEDPIGRFLQATVGSQLSPAGIDKPREIVGIVGDYNQGPGRGQSPPRIYVPNTQHPTEYAGGREVTENTSRQLVLRTTLEPMSLADDLRRIVFRYLDRLRPRVRSTG